MHTSLLQCMHSLVMCDTSETLYTHDMIEYHDTVYTVHLAVILIWRFGKFHSKRQIEITANR